jgi:hypothetical protein
MSYEGEKATSGHWNETAMAELERFHWNLPSKRIAELEADLTKSNHAYLDLQYICDEQAKRIAELEILADDLMANCNALRKRAWDLETSCHEEDAAGRRQVAKEQLVSEGILQ